MKSWEQKVINTHKIYKELFYYIKLLDVIYTKVNKLPNYSNVYYMY